MIGPLRFSVSGQVCSHYVNKPFRLPDGTLWSFWGRGDRHIRHRSDETYWTLEGSVGIGKASSWSLLSLPRPKALVSSPRRASNVSEAALFRTIEKISPTLLLDEAETLSSKSERAEYIRQILNAGNRRGALVTRCTGQGTNMDAIDFSVFCPKVLAGIGNFPQTITDRAVMVSMQRRKDSESVARFLYKSVKPEGVALSQRTVQFISQRKDEIEAAYKQTDLGFISDRDAEAWSPLFAILAIADVSRLKELRDSALQLTQTKALNAEDDNLSLRMLADVRSIWPESEAKIFTAELIRRLKDIEDGPWVSDERLDARKLSRYLKPFGLRSSSVQIGHENKKGFYREEALTAFSRYLGGYPSEASDSA